VLRGLAVSPRPVSQCWAFAARRPPPLVTPWGGGGDGAPLSSVTLTRGCRSHSGAQQQSKTSVPCLRSHSPPTVHCRAITLLGTVMCTVATIVHLRMSTPPAALCLPCHAPAIMTRAHGSTAATCMIWSADDGDRERDLNPNPNRLLAPVFATGLPLSQTLSRDSDRARPGAWSHEVSGASPP
jgi:hypothetical protein